MKKYTISANVKNVTTTMESNMTERTVTDRLNDDQKALIFDNHKLVPGYVQKYFAPHLRRMNISKSQVETIIEESVQKAFEDICERIHTFDPLKGKFSTWVYNTLKFTVRNYFESKIKPDMLVISREDNRENVSVEEMYDEDFNVDKDSIRSAVNGLDEKERAMVDLVFYKDFTIEEAAQELSVSVKEALSIQQKALIALRESVLTHYEKEETEDRFNKESATPQGKAYHGDVSKKTIYWKKWVESSPDHKEMSKKCQKNWRQRNKDKIKEYQKAYNSKKKAEKNNA